MRKSWLLAVSVVLPAVLLLPVGPAPAATTGTGFASNTSWVWVQRSLGETATADQFVSATVSGATTPSRNGGFVVRQSALDRYALVTFSSTRYQVRLVSGPRITLVVDKPFGGAAAGPAVARTEVRGTTITTSWGSTAVSQDTVAALGDYPGKGSGVAIWQDQASTVQITGAVSSALVTTGPPPTAAPTATASPTPVTVPTAVPVPPRAVPVPAKPAPVAVPVPNVVPAPSLSPAPPAANSSGRKWRSGASGTGVANGGYAAWRGSSIDIAGTWNDDFAAQANIWSIAPGAEYGSWQKDMDMSVGGIYKDRGDTWQAAAAGAYDARWRASLTKLNRLWGSRPGTMYIRFAHEFNGDWYPWSVQASEVPAFVTAWKRFRAIQLEVAPRHKLVFCPNVTTVKAHTLDWRAAFPGAQYVDVMSVDAYNQYPFVKTSAEFASSINRVDRKGAPSGLEGHRRFAESVGLPFAVSEWSSNAAFGDSPVFVSEMNRWLTANAGTGRGRVLYEIQFNVRYGDGRYQFFPGGRQSQAAAAYARLF